jgi:hypothetical protein
MLEDAVEHMTTMASYEGNAELFLHRLDGRVERVREADRSPTPSSFLDFDGRS